MQAGVSAACGRAYIFPWPRGWGKDPYYTAWGPGVQAQRWRGKEGAFWRWWGRGRPAGLHSPDPVAWGRERDRGLEGDAPAPCTWGKSILKPAMPLGARGGSAASPRAWGKQHMVQQPVLSLLLFMLQPHCLTSRAFELGSFKPFLAAWLKRGREGGGKEKYHAVSITSPTQ